VEEPVQENLNNMKKTVILFAVLGGFIFLIFGNLFKAGSGHVEVVEKVEVLTEENQKLTEENKTLSSENNKLKVTADSLITKQDSLKESVTELTKKQEKNEIKKISAPRNVDVVDQPYTIIVPIEEVSGSEN